MRNFEMNRNIPLTLLCTLPLLIILVGCSGGTNGLSGLGSSVTTPSTINTKLTPIPTAATPTPTSTVAPPLDPAKQSFALAISGISADYKGTNPTGLPLTKAELKIEKETTTLVLSYGALTAPFEITLIKKGTFTVGDVFTFGAKKGNRASTKFVSVTAEEPPLVFSFAPAKTPAIAKIVAIDGGNYTIELNDVRYSTDSKIPVSFSLSGTIAVALYSGEVVAS